MSSPRSETVERVLAWLQMERDCDLNSGNDVAELEELIEDLEREFPPQEPEPTPELKPFTVHLLGTMSESFNVLARDEDHAQELALMLADERVNWDSTSSQVFEGHDQ